MGTRTTSSVFQALLRGLPALAGLSVLSAMAEPPGASLQPPSKAEEPAAKERSGMKAKPSLICEEKSLTPGSTVMLAVTWELQPKWHMYWPGRNDTGEAATISFELPPGYTVDAVQWPAPERHVEGDLLSHVYFNRLTVLVPLHVPATAAAGGGGQVAGKESATIKAKLAWMVCEETCVPEQSTVKLKMPIAAGNEHTLPGRSAEAKHIEAARKRIPKELAKGSKDVRISWMNKTARIEVVAATHLAFYPDEDCVPFSNPIADGETDGSMMVIRLGDPEAGHTALAGVLEIRRGKEEREWVHIHADPGASPGMTLPDKPTQPSPVPSIPSNPRPQPKPIP